MRKSPVLAGLLSLLPGLGQVYVGYYISGFINILVVGSVISMLDGASGGIEPFLGLFLTFFWAFNIIDAVKKAHAVNAQENGTFRQQLPTDSPLVAGVVLMAVGLLLIMHFSLGMDLEFLQDVWPFGIFVGGAYFIWKYIRTRRSLGSGA